MTKGKTAERLFFLLEASSVFLKRQRSGGSHLIRPLAPPGADGASGRIRQRSKFAAEPAKRNKFRVPQRVVTPPLPQRHKSLGITAFEIVRKDPNFIDR